MSEFEELDLLEINWRIDIVKALNRIADALEAANEEAQRAHANTAGAMMAALGNITRMTDMVAPEDDE